MPPFIGILSASEAREHPECPHFPPISGGLTASSKWVRARKTYRVLSFEPVPHYFSPHPSGSSKLGYFFKEVYMGIKKEGESWGKVGGTIQNDMLKEFIAQKTFAVSDGV